MERSWFLLSFCGNLLLFALDMEASKQARKEGRKGEVCAIKVSYQVREG